MGNQASGGLPPMAGDAPTHRNGQGEPLESFMREKKRDEHLKNLSFKRSKSFRKSISKRLKRKRQPEHDVTDANPPPPPRPLEEDPPTASSRVAEKAKSERKEEKSASVERLDRRDFATEERKRSRNLVGEVEPLPTHVLRDLEGAPSRRMDRLRRSLRSSLRRKKDHRQHYAETTSSTAQPAQTAKSSTKKSSNSAPSGDNSKPVEWQNDEVAVRSGTCSFKVKYLGCVEVYESRGMQVCEEAVRVLKESKRKSVRAILYVHGDGLRVVDDETKGLIVDQTIEKVSFCAPDRNFDRGFSYICRDGTTRRWMCHGFMAVRESGERLSHAVGCAFAICLEKKQERDKLCSVSMKFDKNDSSFTRYGSFRQATLTERLQDPQGIKPSTGPPPVAAVENPHAIARPHATDLMLQRQTSFRGFNQQLGGVKNITSSSPFKRQLSLRLTELPSTIERQQNWGLSSISGASGTSVSGVGISGVTNNASFADELIEKELGLDAVQEETEEERTEVRDSTGVIPVTVLKSQLSQLYQLSEHQNREGNPFLDGKFEANFEKIEEEAESPAAAALPPQDPISSMCQQLSQELSQLTTSNGAKANTVFEDRTQESQSLPYIPVTSPASFPSTVQEEEPPKPVQPPPQLRPQQDHSSTNYVNVKASSSSSGDPLATVKPLRYSNPWDFVPDQPVVTNNKVANNVINSCDSSSGISSSSGNDSSSSSSGNNNGNSLFPTTADDWGNNKADDKIDNFWNEVDNNTEFSVEANPVHARSKSGGILDDPFDAEWAALATRNNSKNNFAEAGNSVASVSVSGGEGSGRSSTNPFHDVTTPTTNNTPFSNGVQAAFELKM